MQSPLSGKRAEALPATVQCNYEDNGQDGHGAKKPDGKDISTEGTVTVSADQRGLSARLSPRDLAELTGAQFAAISAP